MHKIRNKWIFQKTFRVPYHDDLINFSLFILLVPWIVWNRLQFQLLASQILKRHWGLLNYQSEVLNYQGEVLNYQSEVLNYQGEVLNYQSEVLNYQSEVLNYQSEVLNLNTNINWK